MVNNKSIFLCQFTENNELSCGVMVAQQILVLFVWVRVLARQLFNPL